MAVRDEGKKPLFKRQSGLTGGSAQPFLAIPGTTALGPPVQRPGRRPVTFSIHLASVPAILYQKI